MTVDVERERQERDEADRHAEIDAAVKGWTPTGDKVALATLRVTEKKVGSLVTPGERGPMGDKIERRGRLARVVAIGPQSIARVGQRVYCASFAGAAIEVDGHSLLIVSDSELLLMEDDHGF
jgi:co-chaperonin GroES (HSP10)